MLFISEFSQFVMDKSNSVIKFRDTKVLNSNKQKHSLDINIPDSHK